MDAQTVEPESRTIRLGASRSITVGPGSMVLVRQGENESFGAVITFVGECHAELTFTPPGAPRTVPLGMILCSVDSGTDILDLSSIPPYQPLPNRTPRKKRRRAEADVQGM